MNFGSKKCAICNNVQTFSVILPLDGTFIALVQRCREKADSYFVSRHLWMADIGSCQVFDSYKYMIS